MDLKIEYKRGVGILKFSELKKYFGLFVLAVAVIIVYKTFDNLGDIFTAIGSFIGLLTPFVIGAAIAFVLSTPCRKLETLLKRTKVSVLKKYRRGFSILAVYVALILLVTFIMVIIIPQLVNSIAVFADQVPSMTENLNNWISSLPFVENSGVDITKFMSENLLTVDRFVRVLDLDNLDKYAKSVANFGSTLFDVFMGVIISIYMLAERKNIKRAFMRFCRAYMPKKHMSRITSYAKMISDFIKRYIGCQLLDSCIVFILCLIVLSIMRTEYASVIALMIGAFNLIPYFGAIVAVFISALITLVTSGFMNAIILVVVLIVVQQLDANLIQPRLVASSLAIKPLLVIFGVIIGGGLFGVIGMFIGVPTVALISNIITDLVNKRNAVQNSGAENANLHTADE